MPFKILYHEDALADLEEIFSWSKDQHSETTDQFANDLFNHLGFLQAFPYIGTPVKTIQASGGFYILHCTSTTAWTKIGRN